MRSLTLCGVVGIVVLGCSSGSDNPSNGQAQGGASTAGGAASAGSGNAQAGSMSQAGTTTTGGTDSSQGGSSANVSGGDAGGSSGNAGSGGSTGNGGSAGSGGSAGGAASGCAGTPLPVPPVTECPAPAGNTNPELALVAVNTLRAHMGLPCMALVDAINTSSQKHCDYYQQNLQNKDCIANAHAEVETCAGYVDAQFFNRMTKAGYTGSPRSEVMAFSGNPTSAIAQWINSVYHRTPLLSPWIREMGYGMTDDCDTIDMGQGAKTADDVTAVYPYPGQIDLPVSFDGSHEGPTPPEPPTGWPSASPIHLYAKNYTVTSHDVYVSSGCASLPHQWLPDKEQYILYPDKPFAKATEYRVVIRGTRAGKALDFDWTFKTKG